METKIKIGFIAILAIAAVYGLTSFATAYDEIPQGSDVKALAYLFSDPVAIGGGNISMYMWFVFKDKAGEGISPNDYVIVSLNPSGTLASMKASALNALITKATADGYNLAAADIMMPTFMKGN